MWQPRINDAQKGVKDVKYNTEKLRIQAINKLKLENLSFIHLKFTIMRKILQLIIALVFVTAASAQTFQKNPAGKLGKRSVKTMKKLPFYAGEQDLFYWSLFDGSSNDWDGVGTGKEATFGVAILVPGEHFAGSTLKSINIPVISESMTNVTAWVRTNLDEADVVTINVPDNSFTVKQYTKAELTEGYTIPEAGVYVGYTFSSTGGYPVAVAGNQQVANSLFLKHNDERWNDYSYDDFGVSPIQIAVSGFKLKAYNASFSGLESKTTLVNSPFTAQVVLNNTAENAVESIDYTIDVDGKKEQKHLDLETPLSAGLGVTTVVEVEGTSISEAKSYTVTLSIDKVNGQPNADNSSVSAKFINVTQAVAHRTVVEELTGTGCGWCPRGWVGMEYLKENYQDRFVGIAIHQYNRNDPMHVANYASMADLGLLGAPRCTINRKILADPYYGYSDRGIGVDFEELNKALPAADVTAEAKWNEDKTAVAITAKVKPLTQGLGFTVAYVLTADNLSGTTDAWKQSNYYYQYTAAQIGDEQLAIFGKDGEKGQQKVSLVFNDVMIGSSYDNNGKNLAEVIEGADNAELEKEYQGSYSVNMPTADVLKNAITEDLVFANVLVVSNTGEILNAIRVKVDKGTNGINELNCDDVNAEVARYSLDGRRLNTPQKGVNIVKFSNGKTQKMVVR